MVYDNDTDDDDESVDAKNEDKPKRKRGADRVSAFCWVIQTRKGHEESNRRQFASNLEMEKKKNGKIGERTDDYRGLTLRQIMLTLFDFIKGGTFDEETVGKLGADDPALSGIKIEVKHGTVVECEKLGRGLVVAYGVDEKG